MTNDTIPAPIGADAALALLVAAVEAETDPSWKCNSYHPSLWSALDVARAAIASAAQPADKYPPLPTPDLGMPWRVNAKSDGAAHSSGFTHTQMRAYYDLGHAAGEKAAGLQRVSDFCVLQETLETADTLRADLAECRQSLKRAVSTLHAHELAEIGAPNYVDADRAMRAPEAPAAVAGPSDEALRLSVDHAHEILRRLMYHRDGDFFINVNRRGAEAIHVSTIATIVHAALVAAPTTRAAKEGGA